MVEARDKWLKDQAAAAEKAVKASRDIWAGWNVRPYTESEAFLADERAPDEFRRRWEGYGQRPYQESEAVLADQAAWAEWKKQGADAMASVLTLSERTAEAMEQNFSNLFFDAWKGELKSAEDYFNAFTDSIGRMFSDLAGQMMKQALFGSGGSGQPVGGLFGALIGAAGSGSAAAAAKGAVFGPGGLERFAAGGVVTRPTMFPFARGAGVMGEAGPEAILPLKRLPGGDLGVKAEPSAGGGDVQVIVNNNSPERASVRESRGPDNVRQIFVTIGQDIASGGPIARGIEQTYGLRRVGRIA
jgi:lambda family phage tail tape measure protein